MGFNSQIDDINNLYYKRLNQIKNISFDVQTIHVHTFKLIFS